MQPGPNYILKTPITGALVKISSIITGNTFGATFWTDGRCEAPMLPDEPWLRRHPVTDELFWTDECEEIASEFRKCDEKYADVEFALAPSLADYRLALSSGIASTPKKERYLRHRFWWAVNDPVRHGEAGASFPPDHRDNLEKLRAFLNESDPEDRIFVAEISRELGEFEKAAALLDFEFPEDFARAVNRIKQLNAEKDVTVRKIN